jgi:pimeloyl-ACP methyl ester carboxylesterase
MSLHGVFVALGLATIFALPAQEQRLVEELAGEIVAAERRRTASAAFETNYPLARLALKKARLAAEAGQGWIDPGRVAEWVAEGRRALARLEAGQPYYGQPGKLNELAYEAANDGSVQPYYLYLPPDFTPTRKWPLIVFLHGYVPTITVLDPWVLSEEVCQLAGRLGYLLLLPYGRRNTDFQGVGEVDVLTTTARVQKYYPVDERRIYICGVSMGGMGAWNLALRHPGLYAAATPIAGHTEMLRWWGWPAKEVPPFKRWLIEWDNPLDLIMNARSQHIFVQHGAEDRLIPSEQSRLAVAAAHKLGIAIEYYEYPGEGHYIYWRPECYQRAWQWQQKFSLDPAPLAIDFKTYSLEYDTAFWARVGRISQWGQPAVLRVRVDSKRQRVNIEAENVGALGLNLAGGKLTPKSQFEINGRRWTPQRAEQGWAWFELQPPPSTSNFPPLKRRGLCGPIEEAFDQPFLVVQGTAGDAQTDADLAAKVWRWAKEWDEFADGYPRVATDVEVSEEQMRAFNLVLFGTPATNAILARVADRLPIGIGDHEYRVGGRRFAGPDLGLVMCYPNPLAPDHYLVIYAGEWYGDRLPINHKHDLLPDFLIFRAGQTSYDGTDQWVCGGFFDSAWRLSEASTWVNQEAVP